MPRRQGDVEFPQGARGLLQVLGTDDESTIEVVDNEVVPFGRATHPGSTHLRIGHAPTDRAIRRHAGDFFAANGRVIVDNQSSTGPMPPLKIVLPNRPEMLLEAGAAYSPPSDRFEVHVQGGDGVIRISAHVRPRRRSTPTGASSHRTVIKLSADELAVYRALRAPMDDGAVEPARRAEAAASLGYGPHFVSDRVKDVYGRLWASDTPIFDSREPIMAVVQTLMSHGIR